MIDCYTDFKTAHRLCVDSAKACARAGNPPIMLDAHRELIRKETARLHATWPLAEINAALDRLLKELA